MAYADSPRAFEQFLMAQGFSRGRAEAITAKGFSRTQDTANWDPNDAAAIIHELRDRALRLDLKRNGPDITGLLRVLDVATSRIGSVRLLPGDVKRNIAIAPVPPGRVKFKAEAPSFARFECVIRTSVYEGTGANIRKSERKVTLFQRPGTAKLESMSIDRGILSGQVFRNLTTDDVKKYLDRFGRNILYGETHFQLEYNEHEDRVIADLPQRPALFRVWAEKA